MSLGSDVKNRIKGAQKLRLPWWGILLWMGLCAPVIWVCDQLGRLNMALPILNGVAVLSLLIALRWELRRHAWFWVAMTIIAALHAWLIWSIPWTTKWAPALEIAAIDSADFCVLLWVLSAVGKWMDGRTAAEA